MHKLVQSAQPREKGNKIVGVRERWKNSGIVFLTKHSHAVIPANVFLNLNGGGHIFVGGGRSCAFVGPPKLEECIAVLDVVLSSLLGERGSPYLPPPLWSCKQIFQNGKNSRRHSTVVQKKLKSLVSRKKTIA